jgi:signal transduction histidine kinase
VIVGGLLLLAIAAVGFAYGGLVVRAAPDRRDNVVFGALAISDALMITWRAINVLTGESLISDSVTLPCSLGTMVMAVLTFDFLYSFPQRPPMRWRWRLLLIVWTVAAATFIATSELPTPDRFRFAEQIYYGPAMLLTFVFAWRAARSTTDRTARVIIFMLCFRWGFGFLSYFLGPLLDMFEEALWLESTFATLTSFIVIGTSVLRQNLFSIRSAAAEAVLASAMALVVVLGGGGAVFGVLEWTEPGNLQTALLIGATLVPMVLAAAGRALYPRIEANVLAGIDERRAKRLGVESGPLPVEPAEAIEEAQRRISEVGDGATVRWQPVAQLAPAIVEAVRDGQTHKGDDCVFAVPARGAEGRLEGAFLIKGGVIDRDTYVVARDLSTHVALAVERAQAVSELEDARRLAALGQFAAAIAHDIRTPLTSISLNVQILRRKLQLSDDDREHLDIALEELARLDKSVAEILDFAKPVKLAQQAIDVGELVETTTRGLTPVLSEKGVELQCEAADALPTVQGDPQRLRQVIVNLVGNAADASTPGAAVTVRAKPTKMEPAGFTPAGGKDATHVAIEVEDRGRGIQADDLPRIFEPFFTTRPDGTGLGLAICHKVVRAHGGDIQVRSTPGAGSTFTILLPAA